MVDIEQFPQLQWLIAMVVRDTPSVRHVSAKNNATPLVVACVIIALLVTYAGD